MRRTSALSFAAIFFAIISGLFMRRATSAEHSPNAANITATRINAADRDPDNWMSYGRTYSEQRFSPLKQINVQNVSQLGLAWFYDLDTNRGQEATPLVIDGVIYFTTAWSKVFALDAVTGKLIWSHDPKVPGEWAINACCDVVNRGVAAWKGNAF